MITLTMTDNDKQITAAAGELVTITLECNPSTGYAWQVADTSAGELVEVKHDVGDDRPGAPHLVSFVFTIHRDGLLTLTYSRSWAKTDPGKRFAVTVKLA